MASEGISGDVVELEATTHTNATKPKQNKLADFKLNRKQQRLRDTMHALARVWPNGAAKLAALLFLRPRRKPITYIKQLPSGAKPIRILHNGECLVGYAWGTGPRTVLLVHGWESHLGRMLPLVNPLVEAGFRVVAFDAPGHGQSPQWLTQMYDFGEAVRHVIEQQGSIYSIVASSFGGAATALMLARNPNLQPQKMVLLSPMGHIREHLGIFNRLVGFDEQMFARVQQQVEQHLPNHSIAKFDVAQAAETLTLSGLVVHDLDDTVIPFSSGQRIASNWPNARFQKTNGLGHRNVIRNEKIKVAIVEFLQADVAPALVSE